MDSMMCLSAQMKANVNISSYLTMYPKARSMSLANYSLLWGYIMVNISGSVLFFKWFEEVPPTCLRYLYICQTQLFLTLMYPVL